MIDRSVCMVAPRVYLIASGDEGQRFAGGAEVQQSFIAKGLVSCGYRVTILTGDYGQDDEVTLDGVRYLKVRQTGLSLPVARFLHPRLTGLWKGMERARSSIYYQRCSGINTFATAAYAKLRQKRFVFAAASDLDLEKPRTKEIFPGRGGWRELQLYYLGLKRADSIIAQHRVQQAACEKWHDRQANLMPSCYSLPNRVRGSTQEGVVLWVAMLRPGKRVDRFLELARCVPERRFRIIGGASTAGNDPVAAQYFREIEQLAAQIPNVEFLGFLPYHQVERHFDEASLLVNTSEYEGFPNTFLQAWARGVPTVSFVDCGAADKYGPIGFPVDSDDNLLRIVRLLTQDKARWKSESERCRAYFLQNHSLEAVAEKYANLFDRLLLDKATP
jgi:glycosyltransferase involved in cell wall biosynthesis